MMKLWTWENILDKADMYVKEKLFSQETYILVTLANCLFISL